MASTNQNPEQNPDALENLNSRLTDFGRTVETNKKAMGVALGGIILVAALTFAYLYLYSIPRSNKAMEAYNKVELSALGNDSTAAAQYRKVADEYGSTKAGKLAALSAAETLYEMGKYADAAKYLKKFDSNDEIVNANVQILLGDCYVNQNKLDDALKAFKDAASDAKGNPQIAPRALLKMAVVYDSQKKYADALKCYEEIKNEYPEFSFGNGMSVDAYIEREKARI